uniref:DIS3 exosome endoribonuclease and 3'-5' exoribonuclease n=2 Tax=Petromyzon marinus TaxID=7757 RepID=S4RPB2_PETMA
VLASQIDLLEDPCLLNVVILQTVLQEIRHRSAPVYKRLRDIISTPQKHFYAFTNEHHRVEIINCASDSARGTERPRGLSYRAERRFINNWIPKGVSSTRRETSDMPNNSRNYMIYTSRINVVPLVKQCFSVHVPCVCCVRVQDVVESRVIFPEHLPLSQLQQGVRSGRFVQGTFLASRENYLEGTLRVRGDGDSDKEVLIQGLQHLNRAMHDDIVCVEMFPEERWVAPSSLVLHDEGVAGDVAEENEEDVVSGASTLPNQNQTQTPIWTATPREICAVWVPMYQWKRDTGDCGDKETETEVLLLEHDVPHQPFSQAVLGCLPPPTFSITAEKDQAGREDLRALSICSVDPPGCTDIDDALHCKPLDNGNTEVGVHIADVSYFIRPGNALDEEASLRGTTVYLCEKSVLRPADFILSFLTTSRMNNDNLKKKCATTMLNISHDVLNERCTVTSAQKTTKLPSVACSTQISEFVKCLILRFCVVLAGHDNRSCPFSTRRALTLASPEVRFHMDSETHDPIDLQTKELKETNSMVEEFMLLANISVAERIVGEFPECALLRRHPAPPPSNYDILVKAAKSKNIEIQVDSAKALAESLDWVVVPGAPPYLNTLLRILATRCMMQAIYFCSGMEPDTHHYGLSTAIYTHFTLPIRRHTREIDLGLGLCCLSTCIFFFHKQQQLCNNLNYRHKMAQYAQRSSVAFHTQLFFKSKGVVSEEGFVLFVRKNAVVVLIPKYGLEGTVFFDSKDLKLNVTFDEEV